jgi:hypothetical protein
MDMLAIIANFALFQGAWFAAILGGATGQEFLGCLPALGAVILYLFLNRRRFGREVALLVGIGLLGAAFETVLIAAGWIAYTGSAQDSILPPIWIFALWLAFATLPHRSLQWLRGRPWLQGALGAVSGPLSYLAGVKLGAATLPDPPTIAILAIGVGWAIVLPLIFRLADWISGGRQA